MLENRSIFGKPSAAIAIIGLMLASVLTAGVTFAVTPIASAATICENARIEDVSASGYETVNPPENAIDNSEITRWSSEGFGSWIIADLGSQQTICSVDVSWYKGDTRANSFTIAVSDDGSGYANVYSGKSSGETADPEGYSFSQAMARYVKITITDVDNGNGEWVSVSEIDVNSVIRVDVNEEAAVPDSSDPIVAITSPTENSEVAIDDGGITVTGTASDSGSGVKEVGVRIDSNRYTTATPKAAGDWSTWSITLPATGGEHRLVSRVTDNAGNQDWDTMYVTFVEPSVEDTIAPYVEITSPAENSEVAIDDGGITVTGTASDSGSGVEMVQVRVDGGSYVVATPRAHGDWSTWSVNLPITVGEHRLVPRATDNAGNHAWNSIYVTFVEQDVEDTTDPSVAITSPSGGSTVPAGTVTVQGTASDSGTGVDSVQVRVGTGSFVAATPKAAGDWSTWSAALSVPGGQNTITARGTDKADNSKDASITITASTPPIDDIAPSIAITQPSEGSEIAMTGGSIVVSGVSSDSGSGVKEVGVRVDSGSYFSATPKAAGDWSTWSVTLPITEGERRLVPRATDNAGNHAWNSIYVTVVTPTPDDDGGDGDTSSALDNFGIKKIYPTAQGGNEWYVNMNDPYSDPLLQNRETLTKQPDGSWQVSGGSNGQVRLEAWSPSNEKWLNVEITMYAKMVSGSNELLQLYSRGGHHTSSNECLGSAVKARLYGDGEARWVKEINHPAYTSNRGSVDVTDDPLKGRWIGFKAVIYNFVEDGKTYVRMESYIDDDVTDSNGNLAIDNNWKLASVVEDRGGWGTNDSDFNSSCTPLNKDSTHNNRQRDEILNMSGGTSTQNIAAFRSDDLTWNWKYLTVREIDPSA